MTSAAGRPNYPLDWGPCVEILPFRAHGRWYILINELPKGFAETTGAKW
jgi:hypothetical protein